MIGTDENKGAKAAALPSKNISTGIDIEAISRIKDLMQKKAFIKRVFTEEEAAYSFSRRDPARHLAGRFAAKEACLKALGTGLSDGLSWRDIEVVNKGNGSPSVILHGRARVLMKEDRADKKIFISISYCADLAMAFVAIG